MTVNDEYPISDYVSGRDGSIAIEWRFEYRTWRNEFVEDLTPYVSRCQISWDYSRDAMRVADIDLLPGADEGLFVPGTADTAIAVFVDMTVAFAPYSFQLGLFAVPLPVVDYHEPGLPTQQEKFMPMNCPDMMGAALATPMRERYTLATGTNILAAVTTLIESIGLEANLTQPLFTPFVPPPGYSWPAGTPVGKVIIDMTTASGMTRPAASSVGIIESTYQSFTPYVNPGVFPDYIYDPTDEPRLLTGNARRQRNYGTAFNQLVGEIIDPLNADFGLGVIWNDLSGTPLSQAEVGIRTAWVDDNTVVNYFGMSGLLVRRFVENWMGTDRVDWASLFDPRYAQLTDGSYALRTIQVLNAGDLTGVYVISGWSMSTDQPTMSVAFGRIYPGALLNVELP